MDKILVLDFGGQYNQLIARRVRSLNVYAEIINFDKITCEEILKICEISKATFYRRVREMGIS